jgi:hypothetical protein
MHQGEGDQQTLVIISCNLQALDTQKKHLSQAKWQIDFHLSSIPQRSGKSLQELIISAYVQKLEKLLLFFNSDKISLKKNSF